MKKTHKLQVAKRRQSQFIRVREVFERKFDGFPAAIDPARLLTDEVSDETDIDMDAIIDEIVNDNQPEESSTIAPCAQVDEDDALSGDTVTTELDLSLLPGPHYLAPLSVDYFISVWFDGILATEGTDYTEDGDTIIPTPVLDAEVIVMAKYVVA